MRLAITQLQFLTQFWKRRVRSLAISASMSSVPALLIVRQLRVAGALTPATARRYRPQSAVEELEFLRLLRADIIRQAHAGRYYLNQATQDTAAA